ncbi:MAG: BofC C-terminal domain-containing protein [Clostridia bacterium]|nr:BofC C-terminal domain-containing protein [Clostridia bacterium]
MKKIKKSLKFSIIFLLFSLAFFLIIFIISSKNIKNHQDESHKEYNTPSENSLSYIVKDFNGNVAVFDMGSETPIQITEVHTNNLPTSDQKMLQQGIIVKSRSELHSILEDLDN